MTSAAAPLPVRRPPDPPPGPAPGRRSVLGLALGAGGSLLLSACGGVATTGAGGGGDTLRWGWDLPSTWDPVFSSKGWDVHLLSLVYSGLTQLDAKGGARPALASSWRYSHDGRRLTFALRRGLRFSDGTPVNAEAVKKSLERGKNHPKSLIASQLTSIAEVRAPDPHTVVLELTEADYQLPALLAGKTGMVVSPAAFGEEERLATRPVGHGPFRLVSYTQNSMASLRRDPGYWNAEHIAVERFEAYPKPDETTALAALQSGRLNVAQIPFSQVKAAREAGFPVQLIPSMVVRVLDVNTTMKPFDDPAVLAALKYAVDRQALLDSEQFGHGEVDHQPFPPGYTGFDPGLGAVYGHEPERARALLKKAGYHDGVEVTITTAQPQGVPEQLQAQLNRVGFRARIEVIPEARTSQVVYVQHSRALYIDQFAGRESPVQAMQVLFGAEGLMNPSRRTTPELDAAVRAVRRTPLESPRYPEVLRAATSLAVRTMPNVFLYTVPRALARASSVSPIPSLPVVQRFEGVTAG
ncbi:ABC transporter substrate-binding protein [Streptomyces hygroscopicus]|uniref:ABC transporter substrate-binding protein n=1 Tax=Streptomyces hygroscopicus TaxID=1912 RepID=UPI000833BB79|nr:ABC transporter substrate-binding protein [Streptomyces hygroscopicus]GLV78965.1 peptide ABC transporter substrate-binding protein [Streptomyces hygroscopicus subsp. hygroscopicus]